MPNLPIILALLVGFFVAWMPLSSGAQESEGNRDPQPKTAISTDRVHADSLNPGESSGGAIKADEKAPEKAHAPNGDELSEGAFDPDQILALRRSDLNQALERLGAKKTETEAVRRQLAVLDERIETLKSGAKDRGKKSQPNKGMTSEVGADPDDLEGLLRESQRLSAHLARQEGEQHALELQVATLRERLATALDRQIGQLHGAWDQADPSVLRHQLVPKLRNLHQERRALSLAMGQGRGGPQSFSNPDVRGTDDPDALLEMANLYLDREDRLRREIKAVEGHIQRILDEQELESRMAALVYEETFFDESERELSPTLTSAPSSSESAAISVASGVVIGSAAREAASGVALDIPHAIGVSGSTRQTADSKDESPKTEDAKSSSQEKNAPVQLISVEEDEGLMVFPEGNWGESNSVEALRQYVRGLNAKANEFHQKAEEARRRTRDML